MGGAPRRNGSARGLALIFFAVAAGAATADDGEGAFAKAWREVALPWSLLTTQLMDTRCDDDRDAFEACLLALGEIAASHDPPLLPIPDPAAPHAIAWREGETPSNSRRYAFSERVAREFEIVRLWRHRETRALDVASALRHLRNTTVNAENESSLVARAIGALLRRSVDPHTAIAPYPAVDRAYRRDPVGPRLDDRFRQNPRDPAERVRAEQLFERGYRFGRIQLPFVDDAACADVSEALAYLSWRKIEGLILDLRGNAGGVANEAACVADLFLPRGAPILHLEPLVADFAAQEIVAASPVIFDGALAVLIDASSASGAEVIAAALQARGRATLLGERSFGKGTYQRASEWRHHPEVVYYESVARLVVPPGFEFQRRGVSPDLATSSEANLREENAYVNPIAPRYPAIPSKISEPLRRCASEEALRASDGAAKDPVLATAKRILWCQLTNARTLDPS